MQRQRPLRVACASLGAMLLAVLLAAPGRADEPVVYRWIDGDGVSHYTTQQSRIPGEYEDSVQEIRRSSPATSSPSSTVSSPPQPPAVAAPPPAVAAPPPEPPAARVMPEGEFEEAPLGSPRPMPTSEQPAPAPRSALRPEEGAQAQPAEPAAAQPAKVAAVQPAEVDVAAPPPGFIPGTVSSEPPAREAPEAPAAPLSPEAEDALDQRIVALETEIERDQVKLQNILSETAPAEGPRIAEREDFREIAQRLPKLQADLKTLREQRTRTSGL